jgi:hypothetical protein
MALERNPNDPLKDPAANDLRRSPRLDQELPTDSAMADSSISGGKIAAAVVAIVVLVGAIYYGMNMSSTTTATQTSPASPTSTQTANPAVRDITPNRDAGTTTGSAPGSSVSTPSDTTTSPSR